ncbi:MAG: hypothetical protein WAR77_09825 [Saprospiraceae bacterium]
MKNSSFDQWLRQNFKQKKLSLDKEKEWALLEPKLKKKKSRRGLIFWLFFPIAMGALGSYYYYESAGMYERIRMAASLKELPLRLVENKNEQVFVANAQIPNSTLSDTLSEINYAKCTLQKVVLPSIQAVSSSNGTPSEMVLKHIVNEATSGLIHHSAAYKIEKSVLSNMQNPFSNTMDSAIVEGDWSKKVNLVVDLLPTKEIVILNEENPLELLENLEFTRQITLSKNQLRIPISLKAMGSIGILNQFLDGPATRLNTRLALENSESVYGANIMVHTKLKRHYGFGLGLDYQYHTLRFTQRFKDTIPHVLYGQVLLEKVNANAELTKDTGAIVVNEYRNVSRKLYHHRTLISIPITFSYIQDINRSWSLSSILGLSIPVYQKFSGRISNSATKSMELVPYGENISLSKIPCSILYGIQVDYSIRPELKLVLGMLGKRELGFWKDAESGISEKHGSFNFQVGMCYRLK